MPWKILGWVSSMAEGESAGRSGQSQDPMDGDDLVALMKGYQAGDGDSFERLYDFLLPLLRGYLVSLTRNVDLAADLLQESFLQLHRSRRTYCPPRAVKAWAFGITRNVYLMNRRASGRRKETRLTEEVIMELSVPSGARRAVDASLLRGALGELPQDHREALLLHHLWGFSFGEIGGIVGISSGAAKVRAHRGAKKLRTTLQRSQDFSQGVSPGPTPHQDPLGTAE